MSHQMTPRRPRRHAKAQRLMAVIPLLWIAGAASAAQFPDELYERALANDPVHAAAVAETAADLELYNIRRGSVLPQISATGSLQYIDSEVESEFFTRDGGGTLDEQYDAYQYGVSLRQPVFRWDLFSRLERGKIEVLAATVRLRRVRQELVGRLTQAYFDVLAAQDALSAAQSNQVAVDQSLEQIRDRFDVGVIAVTGLREAQARADIARADVISAALEVENAKDRLTEMTGLTEFSLSELKGQHSDLPLKYPTLDQWLEQSLTRNSDVVGARLRYQIAEQDVTQADAGLLPAVDFVAEYGVQDTSESVIGQKSTRGTVALELSVPLWAGGTKRAEARAVRARYLQRAAELRAAQAQAQTAVRMAFRAVRAADRRVEALDAATLSTRAALAAVRDGYEVGSRTIVDVLDAEQAALEAERALRAARYRYLTAMIDLELAAGTVTADDWGRLKLAILGNGDSRSGSDTPETAQTP